MKETILNSNSFDKNQSSPSLLLQGNPELWCQRKAANSNFPRNGGRENTAVLPVSERRIARRRASGPVAKFLTVSLGHSAPEARPAQDEWASLPLVSSDNRRHFLSGVPLVNFFRRAPAAVAFDQLRTHLLHTLRANGWNRVAIASPTRGCGATFTAVNLAQSLARIPGSRTVLMDINHRNPAVATMLGLERHGDMSGFLAGRAGLDQHLVRVSETLALGLANGLELDASEMLAAPRISDSLGRMTRALRPDVVLYDLPPILDYDDLTAFLPHVDAVLLVADGTQTLPRDLEACDRILAGRTPKLGVVLNRARGSGGQVVKP